MFGLIPVFFTTRSVTVIYLYGLHPQFGHIVSSCAIGSWYYDSKIAKRSLDERAELNFTGRGESNNTMTIDLLRESRPMNNLGHSIHKILRNYPRTFLN